MAGPSEGGGMLSSLASAFSPLRDEIVETVDVAVGAYDDIQASMDATSASAAEMGEALRNGAEAYASVAIGAALAGESISAAVGAAMKAEALQYAAKAIGYAAEALFFSVWDPPAAAAAWAASAQAGAAAALFGAGAGVLIRSVRVGLLASAWLAATASRMAASLSLPRPNTRPLIGSR